MCINNEINSIISSSVITCRIDWLIIKCVSIILFIYLFFAAPCRFLVPWPGTEAVPQQQKHRVIPTGPPGKSLLPIILQLGIWME